MEISVPRPVHYFPFLFPFPCRLDGLYNSEYFFFLHAEHIDRVNNGEYISELPQYTNRHLIQNL